MIELKTLEARLAELEFLFTHLERQAADLGRVALEQQARIEALEKALQSLRQARQQPAEEREELDEP